MGLGGTCDVGDVLDIVGEVGDVGVVVGFPGEIFFLRFTAYDVGLVIKLSMKPLLS